MNLDLQPVITPVALDRSTGTLHYAGGFFANLLPRNPHWLRGQCMASSSAGLVNPWPRLVADRPRACRSAVPMDTMELVYRRKHNGEISWIDACRRSASVSDKDSLTCDTEDSVPSCEGRFDTRTKNFITLLFYPRKCKSSPVTSYPDVSCWQS